MRPAGRLLIVEMIPPAGNTPHPSKILDMTMLVLVGGQERSESEYAILLGKAGFEVAQVAPTQTAASVIEAVLAT
jgi:hypothetical protein